MTILFTGASGFLGKIGVPILEKEHNVVSIGRHHDNSINVDLSQKVPVLPGVDVVIHAAGKAHVYPKTQAEKDAFFEVNVTGTRNLLAALEAHTIKAFIYISSVSVYGIEEGNEIAENTPLKGHSPYALSKIQAEELVESWCKKRGVDYIILRLPLIVGSKPLGNLGKMLSAIKRGRYVRIAKGEAKKSMVLASDVIYLISSWLNQSSRISGIYNLTDGVHPSFYQLEEGIKSVLKISYIPSIPKWLGKMLGSLGDSVKWFPVNSGTFRKITVTFTFSDKKARKELGWSPRSVIENLNELM